MLIVNYWNLHNAPPTSLRVKIWAIHAWFIFWRLRGCVEVDIYFEVQSTNSVHICTRFATTILKNRILFEFSLRGLHHSLTLSPFTATDECNDWRSRSRQLPLIFPVSKILSSSWSLWQQYPTSVENKRNCNEFSENKFNTCWISSAWVVGEEGGKERIEKGEEGRLEDEEKRYERGVRKQKHVKGGGWRKTDPKRELGYKQEGEGESIYLPLLGAPTVSNSPLVCMGVELRKGGSQSNWQLIS